VTHFGHASAGELAKWGYASLSQIPRTFQRHSGPVPSVAYSPDGKRIVSGSQDNTLKVWDAQTGKEILTLKGTTGVGSVAYSPDGNSIVSGSGGTHQAGIPEEGFVQVEVWDAQTGQEMVRIKGGHTHTHNVESVSYSPDGKRIVSASQDNTLKVWDAKSGVETLTLNGHTKPVWSVAYSPDGKRIVSGSDDRSIKVWDVRTGQETLTLKGHTSGVTAVASSPQGYRIVSGSADGTIKIWDATPMEEKPPPAAGAGEK
jgi:WD40 repeat protein